MAEKNQITSLIKIQNRKQNDCGLGANANSLDAMLRVPVEGLKLGELTLDAEASRYLVRVHRKQVGDACLLFDPARALEGEATIIVADRGKVICQVNALREASLCPQRPLTLLQGIGKGERFDAIVRDATELSATAIVAVESARTIVRLKERAPARLERWRRIATEAARQCKRGDVPHIVGPMSFTEAVRDYRDSDALKLCFWEDASDPAGPYLQTLASETPVVLVIGPEGGLDGAEVEEARRSGFHIVSLGPLILRTETVTAAALGAILLCGEGR